MEVFICKSRQKCAFARLGKSEAVPGTDRVSALTPPLGDKKDFGRGDAGMSHEKQEVVSVGGQ